MLVFNCWLSTNWKIWPTSTRTAFRSVGDESCTIQCTNSLEMCWKVRLLQINKSECTLWFQIHTYFAIFLYFNNLILQRNEYHTKTNQLELLELSQKNSMLRPSKLGLQARAGLRRGVPLSSGNVSILTTALFRNSWGASVYTGTCFVTCDILYDSWTSTELWLMVTGNVLLPATAGPVCVSISIPLPLKTSSSTLPVSSAPLSCSFFPFSSRFVVRHSRQVHLGTAVSSWDSPFFAVIVVFFDNVSFGGLYFLIFGFCFLDNFLR